jgi:hypothetical protein
MSANHLAVLQIIIPSVIALLIAQRTLKQMRQNELHRQDPKVGIVPPPSPPVRLLNRVYAFCKRNWLTLLATIMLIAHLVWQLAKAEPLSFYTIVPVSIDIACLFAFGFALLVLRGQEHIVDGYGKMFAIQSDMILAQARRLEKLSEIVASMAAPTTPTPTRGQTPQGARAARQKAR